MKISQLFLDVLTDNLSYACQANLNPDNPISWVKTLVGYANDQGGTLFVGVADDGTVSGLDLEAINQAKQLISKINEKHIVPTLKIKYMLRSVDEQAQNFVLAAHIKPTDGIVRYREGEASDVAFINGKNGVVVATPDDISLLFKRKYGVDNEVTDVLYQEKDWSAYLSLCQANRTDHLKPRLKELQSQEIVSKDGYVKSGFIMFSNSYAQDDTMICCRQLDAGEVLEEKTFNGAIPKVFEQTLNFIDLVTKSNWQTQTNEHFSAYPKEAIREAIINAIVHRDYSITGSSITIDIYVDKIEISSPGRWLLPKLYEEYSLGSIPSIRRNPIISATFHVANLMKRQGTGFEMILKSYQDSPKDKWPVVSISSNSFTLCLFNRYYRDASLETARYEKVDKEEILEAEPLNKSLSITATNDNLTHVEKIIAILTQNGPTSVSELHGALRYKSRNLFLKEVINPMIKDDILELVIATASTSAKAGRKNDVFIKLKNTPKESSGIDFLNSIFKKWVKL